MFFKIFFISLQKQNKMGRKKKEAKNIEWEWSPYQKAIFDYIEHGQGHLVVEAAAGSGKTSTLVKCLDLIPETKRVLLSAFNQDIVKELEKRTTDKKNVEVRTLHGLGLSLLKKNLVGERLEPEPFKYESHIKNNIKAYSSINTYKLGKKDFFKYLDNIKKYVDFGRFYLCQTVNDLGFIEDRYGIDTIADEKEIAIEVMEWGKKALETIDFTDMIWLPHALFLKPLGHLYDFIMVDECQDMNKAERELVLKCFKMGTRLISVGDRNQCQPKGTKVLLSSGEEKNIENLSVGDYVVTYNSDSGYYVGYKNKSKLGNIIFTQSKKVLAIEHHTENKIITITTSGNKKSSYTPSHICYARFNKNYALTAYCTYIMRNEKGMYRIGKTKLYRNNYSFSLNHRLISEGCTDAWILNIFETEKEARISELVNSYKFGIPQLVFDMERANKTKSKNPYFLNEEICKIYEQINENIEERVRKCLEYNNRDLNYPIISKCKKNYISKDHFTEFNACNLYPKFMEVNTFNEDNVSFKVNKKHIDKRIVRTPEVIDNIEYALSKFEVYSLEVEDHHNYVADGILTHNCLYSFAGSDPKSFEEICNIPNTICLPLSISYRCAKNIVDFAKRIVPSIEANNDGREGRVLYDVSLDDVSDGDMILCRNNAPLLQVYNSFLKLGKKAFIRGKEIGVNLKNTVKSTSQEKLNVDCKEDGVFVRLYDDLFTTRNKLMDRFGIDENTAMKSPQILSKLDMIKALEILAEGLTTSEEIINKIDEIFKDKKKDGIALSTIHKAKGLEANNVFIACNSLMPSKSATKDWEIQQEYNLMYVAYTRAKNVLGFIDEKDFDEFDFSSTNNLKALQRIELMVNKALNKSTKIIINENNAIDIINRAPKINKNIFTSTTVNINASGNKRRVNSFADLLRNKKTKKF